MSHKDNKDRNFPKSVAETMGQYSRGTPVRVFKPTHKIELEEDGYPYCINDCIAHNIGYRKCDDDCQCHCHLDQTMHLLGTKSNPIKEGGWYY